MGFEIIPSEEIGHRYDFALLANARGYRDAVEVGVDQGVFARDFLSRFAGNWLILIDPYSPYPEMPYDRMLDALVALQSLAPFHGRFRFVRAPSPRVIPWVLTFCSPQFIYIDGSHDEADVRADIEAWWGALPPDGMLAGHDWDDQHPGVRRAVEEFARERGLVVRLTHEQGCPRSWYVYRGEPETLKISLFRSGEEANPRAEK